MAAMGHVLLRQVDWQLQFYPTNRLFEFGPKTPTAFQDPPCPSRDQAKPLSPSGSGRPPARALSEPLPCPGTRSRPIRWRPAMPSQAVQATAARPSGPDPAAQRQSGCGVRRSFVRGAGVCRAEGVGGPFRTQAAGGSWNRIYEWSLGPEGFVVLRRV